MKIHEEIEETLKEMIKEVGKKDMHNFLEGFYRLQGLANVVYENFDEYCNDALVKDTYDSYKKWKEGKDEKANKNAE